MYTNGIRKILTVSATLPEAIAIAEKIGYDTVCHNGVIWARGKQYPQLETYVWVETQLNINDFKILI